MLMAKGPDSQVPSMCYSVIRRQSAWWLLSDSRRNLVLGGLRGRSQGTCETLQLVYVDVGSRAALDGKTGNVVINWQFSWN
jgi:hypothetical protein